MENCDSCPSNGSCGKDENECQIKNNHNNKINKIIGVMSGKGGVGKSTVSVMLAKELNAQGYKVGIMDGDITGPSICRLMGLNGREKVYGSETGIFPLETKEGIKIISLNLLLEDENSPVIWRGALLSSCITQFWTDVLWGELDYLIVDMPPGTADITLTIMQTIPLSGVIVVSVPQDMVSMIVSKSINMAKKMGVHIYGIIENMSYYVCPHCNEKIKIFNGNISDNFLKLNDVELLAETPVLPSISSLAENGYENVDEEIKEKFEYITTKIK